ncbi:chemotaxis protein CheB [Sphingomonas sp. CROZ-RG-20F-R02-07]|uniref:chemotaxis protein CheB n=1 Tax=Sphingomonas sp. CROZ-RG-20F-R02-07 TaxID=2914832 RepID=UPI001F574563|nr:chemotaxis protein CheB [Sphingomonas sp. CROZ-RG-20F-R02-07]
MALAQSSDRPPSGGEDSRGRILIVDDSVVMRAVLQQMVQAEDRFVVSAAVAHAGAAIAFLKQHRVDVILLDLEMPGMNGLTALPDLIAVGQGARVLVVSSSATEGAMATIQAMALGAVDTLVKPGLALRSSLFADMLVDKLGRLIDWPATTEPEPRSAVLSFPPRVAVSAAPARGAADYDVVAIGASTGGIHALGQLFRQLPKEFHIPVLVTQHLPSTFMPFFAAQVATLAGRPCDVAIDRMRLMPGRVVLAPGDAHIRLVSLGDGGVGIRLSSEPAASGCTPSVDPMFETLAEVFGARALAVVLSGMGRDGADGARLVHAAGGCVVVQDRESSVVWGMPGAAADIADAILAPDDIGALIATRRRP